MDATIIIIPTAIIIAEVAPAVRALAVPAGMADRVVRGAVVPAGTAAVAVAQEAVVEAGLPEAAEIPAVEVVPVGEVAPLAAVAEIPGVAVVVLVEVVALPEAAAVAALRQDYSRA